MQVEHVHLAVVLLLSRLGQLRHVVQVLVDAHQTVEEVPDHIDVLEAGGPVRVKARDVLLPGAAQRPTGLGLLRGGNAEQPHDDQKSDRH